MRIQAGKLKGRKLIAPKSGLRPTTGVVKTALINIIKEDIKNKTFLDLFAGTGAVGFEALSAGAKEVFFVDLNPLSVKLIQQNIQNLNLLNAHVVRSNALDFLTSRKKIFDFIFLSPPYDSIHWHQLLRALEQSTLVGSNSLIVVQHPKTILVDSFILQKTDERKYGFNKLTFFKKGES